MPLDTEQRLLMQAIAEEVSSKTAMRMLIGLGIDPNNPIAAQQDFAALRDMRTLLADPEMQKDLLHLRRWRRTMDTVKGRGVVYAIWLGITAVLASIGINIDKFPFLGGS